MCAGENNMPPKNVPMSSRFLRAKPLMMRFSVVMRTRPSSAIHQGSYLVPLSRTGRDLLKRFDALKWKTGDIAVICDNEASYHMTSSSTGMINYREAKSFMRTGSGSRYRVTVTCH